MEIITTTEKSEMQVYKDMKDLLTSFMGFSEITGWTAWQWAQESMQTLKNNSILMNFVNGRRYGWVSTGYNWDKTTEQGTATVSWRREIHLVFSFYKNRTDATSVSYFSAEDMARRFFIWIQSDLGIDALRAKSYWQVLPNAIMNPVIVTGTEKYERMPNFEITFVVSESQVIDVTENFATYETMLEEFRKRQNIELVAV